MTIASHDITSLTGKIWRIADIPDFPARCIAGKFNVPDIVARVALGRGISPETFEDYNKPTLRGLMPEPYHFLDMEKAVTRTAQSLFAGETLGVIGDYDVDGASSSALLARYFTMCGIQREIFIPDRHRDGYGPCNRAYDIFINKHIGLCLTVDCGISAFDPVSYGNSRGIETVILDHHLGGVNVPDAHAIVNPNRLDENTPFTYLAGAGVTFMFLVALNRMLKLEDYFKQRGLPEPDLKDILDIVALATICDVVPLKGLNRAFVQQGLKIMAKRKNIGLCALADRAGIRDTLAAYHLGFVLGPRINAGGRVGDSSLGMRLLSTEDPHEARALAEELERCNEERKTIEQRVSDEAMAQAEAAMAEDAPFLFAAGEDWHEGVIGIVAGRMKEAYHRPSAVLSILPDGTAKASARSVEGADVGAAIVAAVQEGLLIGGGGHAMAGGFSVAVDKLEAAKAFLSQRVALSVAANPVPVLTCDAMLRPAAIRPDLARALSACEPYGAANPTPRFVINHAVLLKVMPLGQGHLKLIFKDEEESGSPVKGLLFRAESHPAAAYLMPGARLSIAGSLTLNRWQGMESAEIIIEDVANAP